MENEFFLPCIKYYISTNINFLKKTMINRLIPYIKSLSQSKKERRHSSVGPASLWKMKRDFQIEFLKSKNLRATSYLLDIGCGTLRGGIPIIKFLNDGHYYGVEPRAAVLEQGQNELAEEGLQSKSPILIASTLISETEIDQSFDVIWAFSVLIHMDDDTLKDTLEFVHRQLSKHGVFYANVNIGDLDDGIWQGFPVVHRTLEFYQAACKTENLELVNLGALKELGHISNDALQDNQRMLQITRT